MVNENLIPKFEEIREIKNEIPTYEEFLRNYEYDENITNSYHLENQAQEKGYGPALLEPSYEQRWKKCPRGCGVYIHEERSYCGERSCMTEEEKKKDIEDSKMGIGLMLSVTSVVCPPAAAAMTAS